MLAAVRDGPLKLGRYVLHDAIASGGMATVHFGRLQGVGGFQWTVAIKRLHPHLANDAEFVAMFHDEARLASRVQHPNVVQTFDTISETGELFVVMEYVHGESLARLQRDAKTRELLPPLAIVSAIVCGALHGLHAAHEAKSDKGEPLSIVHRDVSPQNIIVGVDGVARVLDFGVAKAKNRLHATEAGKVKGKLGYMAPEQLRGGRVDRRADVYAAGVVLWELLTGEHLAESDPEGMLDGRIAAPSSRVATVPAGVDAIVLRALARDPSRRFDDARQMSRALEAAVAVASASQVGEWVEAVVGPALQSRADVLASIESGEARGPSEGVPSPAAAGRGESSQVSTIAVSTSKEVPGGLGVGWRARRGILLSAGLALLAVLGLVARSKLYAPGAAGVATTTSPDPPVVGHVDVAAPTDAVPPPTPPGSSGASPSSTQAPSPRTRPSRTSVSPKPSPSATPAPQVSTPKVSCSPPYRLGPDGEKLWIPECL
jgi:serine/threonine protein kinase